MIDAYRSADKVLEFFRKHGYDPRKVAENGAAVAVMATWVKGEFTDADVLKSFENLEVLTRKSFKIDDPLVKEN